MVSWRTDTAVLVQHDLRAGHEVVEDPRRLRVLVEVESAESDEDGDGGPQVGQELAAPRHHPLPHGRQQPLAGRVVRQLRPVGDAVRLRWCVHEPGDDSDVAGVAVPGLEESHPIAERCHRARVEHDVTGPGLLLGRGQRVHQLTGQDVDQLHLGVADDEAVHVPHRDGDLHAQAGGLAARRDHAADAAHHLLHLQAARRRPAPVVLVDPRRHGVPAEVDDARLPTVQHLDQGSGDPVDGRGQLLGPASLAVGAGERLGERGVAGDVDEHGGAVRQWGQVVAARECASPVLRDVGLRVVPRQQRPHQALPPGTSWASLTHVSSVVGRRAPVFDCRA